MTVGVTRRLAVSLALTLGSGLTLAQPREAPPSPADAPLVYSAEVDSIIHPVSAEYMIQTMDRADRAGATLVVFTLRTPGGLVDSTRAIVSRMIAARTPVAIFVGPAGARAASAGFILTIAADVAAMSRAAARRWTRLWRRRRRRTWPRTPARWPAGAIGT
jgi:membrane-bound serine protease (ClpP class)